MRKLYREAGRFGEKARLFQMTGERRAPKHGEFYLSGAIPEAWEATADYTEPFYMLREVVGEDKYCPTCGQLRKPV